MAYLIPNPTAFPIIPDFGSFPGVSGYHLDFINTTQMFLTPGYARAFGSDFPIVYPSFTPSAPAYILLDTTVVGAGGCWPFAVSDLTLANDTVFGIYVIAKSSGTTDGSLNPNVNVSAVIATGDNFLPPGYDSFRRVGLCYISSSTNLIIPWTQGGLANDRNYILQDAVGAVIGGSATVGTVVDLTANDGVVPPGHAQEAQVLMQLTPSAAGQTLSIQSSVLTAATQAPIMLTGNVAAQPVTANATVVCGIVGSDVFSQTADSAIKYNVSNGAAVANIYVSGFTDTLGNNVF